MEEGWGYLIGSENWHYFKNGKSVCGTFKFTGKLALESREVVSSDNCKECRDLIEARQKAKGKLALPKRRFGSFPSFFRR